MLLVKKIWQIKRLYLLLCLISTTSCYKVYQGYPVQEISLDQFISNKSQNSANAMAITEDRDDRLESEQIVSNAELNSDINVSKVTEILGSPTYMNRPFNDFYCYIQGIGSQFLFLRFANPGYNFICFKFDENARLYQMHIIKNKKIKMIELNKKKIDIEKPK